MSVDGRVCSVGSANLDVTAGYWESELLLVVEDASVANALEKCLEKSSPAQGAIDRDDPPGREAARRRKWMVHWPGVLSI